MPRETLASTASGLPNCAMWARSLRHTASITDSGTPMLVAFEVVQHRPRRGPSAGGGAVHGERAAQAVVVAGEAQDLRELLDAGTRAVAAQLEQLSGLLVGIVREHGRDRALAERGHVVAEGIDRRA